MKKYNKRLPFLSITSLSIALVACALSGCSREPGQPMPVPGKPPRPQASLQLPSASLKNALFTLPPASVRYDNGQVLIKAHRVIHT